MVYRSAQLPLSTIASKYFETRWRHHVDFHSQNIWQRSLRACQLSYGAPERSICEAQSHITHHTSNIMNMECCSNVRLTICCGHHALLGTFGTTSRTMDGCLYRLGHKFSFIHIGPYFHHLTDVPLDQWMLTNRANSPHLRTFAFLLSAARTPYAAQFITAHDRTRTRVLYTRSQRWLTWRTGDFSSNSGILPSLRVVRVTHWGTCRMCRHSCEPRWSPVCFIFFFVLFFFFLKGHAHLIAQFGTNG